MACSKLTCCAWPGIAAPGYSSSSAPAAGEGQPLYNMLKSGDFVLLIQEKSIFCPFSTSFTLQTRTAFLGIMTGKQRADHAIISDEVSKHTPRAITVIIDNWGVFLHITRRQAYGRRNERAPAGDRHQDISPINFYHAQPSYHIARFTHLSGSLLYLSVCDGLRDRFSRITVVIALNV